MKKRIKQLWVDALRSHEFYQGRGRLCTVTNDGEHRFCCLGVLCELHAQEHPQASWVEGPEKSLYYEPAEGEWREGFSLPDTVIDWAGPGLIPHMQHLVRKNDTFKQGFFEIARYVEDNVPEDK